jgi:hypothetical protein
MLGVGAWHRGAVITWALQNMKKTPPRRVARAKPIPLSRRVDVTRAEFNRVIALLNERSALINDLRYNQEIQFKRIAQLQAELDLFRRAAGREPPGES